MQSLIKTRKHVFASELNCLIPTTRLSSTCLKHPLCVVVIQFVKSFWMRLQTSINYYAWREEEEEGECIRLSCYLMSRKINIGKYNLHAHIVIVIVINRIKIRCCQAFYKLIWLNQHSGGVSQVCKSLKRKITISITARLISFCISWFRLSTVFE